MKNHSRDLHSPQTVKHISQKAFFKHALTKNGKLADFIWYRNVKICGTYNTEPEQTISNEFFDIFQKRGDAYDKRLLE